MEKYLDKCLTSLIIEDHELMKQLEVLVIIDGAKDRSSEIAHRYQSKYPDTFVVIDKENGNYGSCINRGIQEACGKYVKILDADDSFDTSAFYKYLDNISGLREDVDVILSGYYVVDEQDNITSTYLRNLPKNTCICWPEVSPSLLGERHLAMHEIAYRVSILREMKYFQTEGISYTDQEWIYYPMTEIKKFYVINEYIYKYLVGRAGQTMDPAVLTKGVGAHITIANRMLTYYHNNSASMKTEVNEYLKHNLLWILKHIYSICLLSKSEGVELSQLITLDSKIQVEASELSDRISGFGTKIIGGLEFKYAKRWRQCKNKSELPFSIQSLIFYRKLFFK